VPGGAGGGSVTLEPVAAASLTTTPPGTSAAAASAASVSTSAPGATSPEDMAAVNTTMRNRVASIRDCFQHQLARDPRLNMRLRVRFRIELNGTVSNAASMTVVSSGDPDAALEVSQCVETVIRDTTFPARASGNPIEMVQPFVFTPTGGASTTPSLPSAPGTSASPNGTADGPTSTGRIDPAQVSSIVRARVSAVRDCYNRALTSDASLTGRVQVRFTVGTDGHIVRIGSDPVTQSGNPTLMNQVARCIEGVLQPAVFPAPTGGPAAFALPFEFGPGR
jgi:outer membrane biosynthesis protein TonB